ncbi:MAG: hypothetical protein KC466_12045, partial [Myxococcales bacterium]|nr:hypothetical protein [Myxococcales bacterium]
MKKRVSSRTRPAPTRRRDGAIAIVAALVLSPAGGLPRAWALTCTDFSQPAAAEQLLARVIRDLPGDRIDFSGDGLVNAGDSVVAMGVATGQTAPPEGCRGPDLLALADVCLNVAS